ncbi:MAG TPA: tryptophan 7-halogenase [Phycisphaerae bacterium]|jgi:tryptophan halogenase
MVRKILVIGSGAEACLAAVMLKTRLAGVQVTLLADEADDTLPLSITLFGAVLQKALKPHRASLFAATHPAFSLGTRYLAGKRGEFHLPLVNMPVEGTAATLSKAPGYYYGENDFDARDALSAAMSRNRLFFTQGPGIPLPKIHDGVAYSFDNHLLLKYLREMAQSAGVNLVRENINQITTAENDVKEIRLQSGTMLTADLYIDATATASKLLGRLLQEPFMEVPAQLPCDRVIEVRIPRAGAPLKPYHTCQAKAAGWSCQTELTSHVIHADIYSSKFITDDAALAAFGETHRTMEGSPTLRHLRCGRYARRWVGNVVAAGAAACEPGPLQVTLDTTVQHVSTLIETLLESELEPTPTQISALNDHHSRHFDSICGYLAILHKFSDRMQTPFWHWCREHVDLGTAQTIVDFFQENGPTAYWGLILIDSVDPHGVSAYMSLLQGLNVPFRRTFKPNPRESALWQDICRQNLAAAASAMTPDQVMAAISSPQWKWNA